MSGRCKSYFAGISAGLEGHSELFPGTVLHIESQRGLLIKKHLPTCYRHTPATSLLQTGCKLPIWGMTVKTRWM